MLPRGRFIHSRGLHSFKNIARPLMMSESTSARSIGPGESSNDGSSQHTSRHAIKDRRWTFSPRIEFQQPSPSPRSTESQAYDVNDIDLGSRETASNCSTHLRHSALSSQPGPWNANLNLRATGPLSYPDLSLASYATSSDVSTSIASPPSPDRQTSTKESAPSLTDNSTGVVFSTPDEPFHSPHGFHIPQSRLEKAMNSTGGSEDSFWQYTLYEGPGAEREKVKLHYCKSKETTEAVSRMFLDEEVIGFDIEWIAQAKSTDGIKKNVALIQIASEERIALFHIARYPGPETAENLVAPTLKKIMESPDITKVGVAIKGDCSRLRKFLGVHCQGLFELSYLHKLVQYCSGHIDKIDRRPVRLAEQVQTHLKLPLCKGEVQTSNWSRDLDRKQTQYAASDSYAGLLLFHVLELKRKALDPMPPRPAHAELNLAISLGENGQNNRPVEQKEDEEEQGDSQSVSSSDMSIEELAREYFHVSLNDGALIDPKTSSEPLPVTSKAEYSQVSSVSSTPERSKEPEDGVPSTEGMQFAELEIANQFVAAFKAPANRRVAPQALRAYSLWHNQGLTIPKVAERLRSPPIQHSTVISYLCDAINSGNLKYEPEKILQFASKYNWRPFIKAHRDLFDRARRRAQLGGVKDGGRVTTV